MWDNLDPWIAQEPEKTKEQLAYMMTMMIDIGSSKFYQHGNTVFFVTRLTPFLAEMHLFSKENSFELVRNIKGFLIEFWATTQFVKLQVSFKNHKLKKVALRTGFLQEGISEKSYMLPTGELVNQYLYGVKKWVQ